MPTQPATTLFLRLILVGWAGYSLWLAFLLSVGLSMEGFPDGYITPYAASTNPWLNVIAWLTVAQAVYFLWRALRGRNLRPAMLVLQLAAAAALTLLPVWVIDACPRWNLCGEAYQSLTGSVIDDGAGG